MTLESAGQGFIAELDLTQPEIQRVMDCLYGKDPAPWHAMSELGHRSRLAYRYAGAWLNYRTPLGYLEVSTFIGARLLLDTAAAHGLPHQGPSIEPLLQNRAPVRYIRRKLLAELLHAGPLVPWPTMRAPFPSLLVLLPQGGMTVPVVGREPDGVAALVIHCNDTIHGLELAWVAYGWGGSNWGESWSVRPMVDIPLSCLAWSIVGLLQGGPSGLGSTPAGAEGSGAPEPEIGLPSTPWLVPTRAATGGGRRRSGLSGSKTPHWRRAHPHRFWTGRKRGERKLVTRWLPALWVAGEEEN